MKNKKISEVFKTKKLLEEQLDLLSEESKKAVPEHECDYAYAMVCISKELFRRKCLAAVFLIAVANLLLRSAEHRK